MEGPKNGTYRKNGNGGNPIGGMERGGIGTMTVSELPTHDEHTHGVEQKYQISHTVVWDLQRRLYWKLLPSLTVNVVRKSVGVWRHYEQKYDGTFLTHGGRSPSFSAQPCTEMQHGERH